MKTMNFLDLFPNISLAELGARIREVRKKIGEKHSDIFGDRYSREMVRLVEQGEYHPSFELVLVIAKASDWNFRKELLNAHNGALRINEATFDQVVKMFLELPEASKSTIIRLVKTQKVRSYPDLRLAFRSQKYLKEDPLACYFLLRVLDL